MKILVTGGAGYIGSFMVKRLLQDNHEVTVVDSLERGHQDAVDKRATLKIGNLADTVFVDEVLTDSFDAIIHFAAYISMAESMQKPFLYFENNTYTAIKFFDQAIQRGINKIIFSSTAGVYGNPVKIPIPEAHPKNPENPYGESKLMVEQILSWYQKINDLNFITLRYFNACGAGLDGSMGEAHNPESHIIPNVMKAALQKIPFMLFGDDYKTPDGTCVRDYIHVLDLVEAHVLALQALQEKKGGFFYNVGTGKGYSNKEVIEVIEKVSGVKLDITIGPRRPGDADELVADATAIMSELQFRPQYSDIETIVKTAWAWHTRRIS